MPTMANPLPDDPAQLKAMLIAERARAERLEEIIKAMQRHRFGRRAETLSEDQLLLGLEDVEQTAAATEAADESKDIAKRTAVSAKRRANRGALPLHLPRIEILHDLDDKSCPCCRNLLHKIGEDRSERLDIVPAQFRVLVTCRPRYACRTCEDVVIQAAAPARLIESGLPTEATVAQVLVSKFADHLPLYRQAQIYARQGVRLDRSTLADWVGRAAFHLRPIYERLLASLRASPKLFADETTAPVLDPGRGRTKTGQFWAYARDDRPWGGTDPPAVVYVYAPDRKAERPITHLAGFCGILQVDGYIGNGASQAIQLISKLVTAAVLYFGAKAVIAGDMSVGELVAFNMLSGRVAQPVLRLAQVWQDFHQARVSVERLGDILNAVPEPAFSPGSASLPKIRGAVSFDHVTFRYRLDGQPALQDVSLDVLPGQVVGIVGPSGSGKSTLTKLVQRLYVPESGRVLVDGVDIGVVDASWLRRQVGVVLQENVLFNRSIRDNIALADPGLTMDRIIAAAELAGAHEFILELPHGYDTVVGERGASLSGGQRQRIAIARALIGDPRILIFDEATSALDYESERVIQDNMRRIARSRTVLVIAHRLSTVRTADRILTLERGRLVEDGSHDELIRSGGRYANLHRLQAGLHEVV